VEALRFLDLLDTGFNAPDDLAMANAESRLVRTENNSSTYANSGNACLDFFFQVVPTLERVRSLLSAAWARDLLTALKLVCNIRGVRALASPTGRGSAPSNSGCMPTTPGRSPATSPPSPSSATSKDFPELLYRLVHGAGARKAAKDKAFARKKMCKAKEACGIKLAAGRKLRRGRGVAAPQPAATYQSNLKPMLSDFITAALSTKAKRSGKPEVVIPRRPWRWKGGLVIRRWSMSDRAVVAPRGRGPPQEGLAEQLHCRLRRVLQHGETAHGGVHCTGLAHLGAQRGAVGGQGDHVQRKAPDPHD
jgi:hypothetical protein